MPSARLDADLLVAHALHMPRMKLYMDLDRPMSDDELTIVRAMVQKRRRGEPMAYILGVREFYGHSFEVTPDVLIPRPDTETLVEWALGLPVPEGATVLDLCTGSGCVAISLAAERPWQVVGTDVSTAALEVARRNGARVLTASKARRDEAARVQQVKEAAFASAIEALAGERAEDESEVVSDAGDGVSDDATRAFRGLAGGEVQFLSGDLYAALPNDARFSLIVSNPPYIAEGDPRLEPEVLAFEPKLALMGGGDGLDVVRRLVAGCVDRLLPGGFLGLEIGQGQHEAVGSMLRDAGFQGVGTKADLAGVARVVFGQRPFA